VPPILTSFPSLGGLQHSSSGRWFYNANCAGSFTYWRPAEPSENAEIHLFFYTKIVKKDKR